MESFVITEKYSDVPQNIMNLLRDYKLLKNHVGCTNANVYKIVTATQNMYLKTHEAIEFFSFAHEVKVMNWLKNRLNVPEVVEHAKSDSHEYLLLTEIQGKNCLELMDTNDYEQITFLLAEGLRLIHSVDISDCLIDETLDVKLKNVRYRVDNNLVIEEDFDDRWRDKSSHELYELLMEKRPVENDFVFGHGDYCLPNILIQNDSVSGFIDLDRAGVSDKYNDLAIASRSIAFNLGAKYEELFFKYYGIDDIDWEKVEYFRLLDEMF